MFQADSTKPEEFKFGGQDGKTIDFIESQKALSEYSNRVLQVFTQTRERVFEIQNTIADTIPRVTRLGGNIADVSRIIGEVASASRRNVLASKEDVEGLYALTQVLGGTAEELANAFLDVGRGIEKIPEELGESIKYIQSIGGNARSIMADVTKNMGVMNRFQFNEGVQGLTKMAAQASMLRFDMSKTFEFAENLYRPEEAIRVAAAFQRMGVAIGSLGDPLQLMNQSINDPSGLQDSLVEVSKQFTYLDQQTKTFKMTRQGVLILKELGEEVGINANEMMKMGLAAAELDQRLSAINQAGLTIANEEDKQYLANIAKMEGGTYKVTMDDGTKTELSQLNQEEFEELIDQQKNAPKGLEETAKAALRLDEIISKNVEAIKNAVVGEVLTVPTLQDAQESLRGITEDFAKQAGDFLNPEGMNEVIDEFVKDFKENFVTSVASGNLADPNKLFEDIMGGDNATNLTRKIKEQIGKIFTGSEEKLEEFKEKIKTFGTEQFSIDRSIPTRTRTTSNELMTTTGLSVGGTQGVNSNPVFSQSTQPRNANVNVGGEVNVNVRIPTLPANFTPSEIAQAKQMIQEAFQTQVFMDHIKKIVSNNEPIKPQS